MLKRKQSSTNEDWIETFRNIHKIITKSEIDNLVDRTVEDIKKNTKGKNTVLAWSGGKDSIALYFVCELAGIKQGLCTLSDLEYPEFEQWIYDNKPDGISIINTGQGLEWLSKNQHMLFPRGKEASRWFSIVQHKGQRTYAKNHNVDVLILGRRKSDGNYVGKSKGENIYKDRQGFTRFSPIAEWKHEHVLALIHYYKLKLPPLYNWKDGFRLGTHPWAARPFNQSLQQGWKDIYDIDPNIVEEASIKINSAKKFIKGEYTCKHKK